MMYKYVLVLPRRSTIHPFKTRCPVRHDGEIFLLLLGGRTLR